MKNEISILRFILIQMHLYALKNNELVIFLIFFSFFASFLHFMNSFYLVEKKKLQYFRFEKRWLRFRSYKPTKKKKNRL